MRGQVLTVAVALAGALSDQRVATDVADELRRLHIRPASMPAILACACHARSRTYQRPIRSTGEDPMPVIQIDLREGLTDDQKRGLAQKVIKAVSEGAGAPFEHIHLVIRESRGINFVFGGEHVPEFEAPKAARAS